jgi:hypothetical protein
VIPLTTALLLLAGPDGGAKPLGENDGLDELEAAAAVDAGAPQQPLNISVLEGRVQTRGTRDPIAVASVSVGEVYVETDADGRFSLELPPGEVVVHVAAAGHLPKDFTEKLEVGQRLEVVYRLERSHLLPYETTIRDQRARTEVARAALRREEAHETPGTMGDPLRSVMQLPGVTSVVSGLAYPVVRGTEPAATAYFLDGVRIPQLFHALAGPSVIHPDFIDQVDFYAGVPPARFGRLLGGAIDATTTRPPDHFSITGSIDLINASAFAQVPIEKTGTTFSVAARGSYTPLVGAAVASAVIPHDPGQPPTDVVANFYDYQARITQKVGDGKLRLLAFGSSDAVGTQPNGGQAPTGVFSAIFHRVDLLWQAPAGPGTIEIGATFGRDLTNLHGDQGGMRFFEVDMARWLGAARLGWFAALPSGLTIRAGSDIELQWTTSNAQGISGSLSPMQAVAGAAQTNTVANGFLGGIYVQARYVAGPFDTMAGVRVDVFGLEPNVAWGSVEPRLDERLKLSDRVTVRAAAGLFHMPPTLSLAFPSSDLAQLGEGLQWAAHTEVGADVQLPLGIEIGVTGFYNPLFRTVEHSVTELLYPSDASAVTHGDAYGVELFLRRAAAGRWFGWLSATLQRSERLETLYRFGDNGNVLGSLQTNVPSSSDELLTLHLVVGAKLPYNITAGISLHFNTGRPEDGEISSRTMRPVMDPVTGLPYWTPQDLDRVSRLPPYFRADFRVSKLWAFDDWQLEAYLDVLNASVTKEVLAYQYSVSGNSLSQTPLDVPIVLPMLGVKGRY